jgi:hypothetical protein
VIVDWRSRVALLVRVLLRLETRNRGIVTQNVSNGFQRAIRSWGGIVVVIALLSTLSSVSAQQPTTPSPSQASLPTAEAKSAIDTALKPIGDEQAIRNLDSCVVTGALKQGVTVGTFTWKSAAQESWAETNLDSVHIVAASNHGKPMRLIGGRTRELSVAALVNTIPLYHVGLSLLRSRDDATLAIAVSPATANGAADVRITQAKPKDQDIEAAYETWTFDPQTGLPASHVLKPFVYHGRPVSATAQYKFSDYLQVSGVNVPHHIEEYMNDQFIRSFDIQSIQCGVPLSGQDFEVSGGAR